MVSMNRRTKRVLRHIPRAGSRSRSSGIAARMQERGWAITRALQLTTTGRRVREIRRIFKLTQKELAECSGIRQAVISRIERDLKHLGGHHAKDEAMMVFAALARVFRVSPADLLWGLSKAKPVRPVRPPAKRPIRPTAKRVTARRRERKWWHQLPDRSGAHAYTVLIRGSDDPERAPRPKGRGRVATQDVTPHLTIAKTTATVWASRIAAHMNDGILRTFNRIAVELTGKTADVVFKTTFEDGLWLLVERGLLEYTPEAPVLFRKRKKAARRADKPRRLRVTRLS